MPQEKDTNPHPRGAGSPRHTPAHSKSSAELRKGKTWFLGIGINSYQHFPKLNNAVKDVEDINRLLLEQYHVEAKDVLLLLDEQATRVQIIDQLDKLVAQIGEEDRLIIYYSGHGHLSSLTKLGYWIPFDAQKDRTAFYISNSTIRDYIKAIKARHILLISDSCFSGSLFVRGAGRSGSSALTDWEKIPSRWALCSGRHDEEVYDGEPGRNSPFAESILDTLRTNQHQALNIAKLADQVVEQTRSNYEQLPEGNPLYGVGHKGGQFVFRRRQSEAEDWAACQMAGTIVAYQTFLTRYPEGQFAAEAQKNIASLQEEKAWAEAQKAHTLSAYYEFDQAYPQGRYTREVLTVIAELEEEEDWQAAQQLDEYSGYRNYMQKYPDGRYHKVAAASLKAILDKTNPESLDSEDDQQAALHEEEERLHAEREAADWAVIQQGANLQNLKVYLQNHPQGAHVAEAQRKLKALENAQREEKTIHWKRYARWAALALLLPLAFWMITKMSKRKERPPNRLSLVELQEKAQVAGLQITRLNLKWDGDKIIVTGVARSEAEKNRLIVLLKKETGGAPYEEHIQVMGDPSEGEKDDSSSNDPEPPRGGNSPPNIKAVLNGNELLVRIYSGQPPYVITLQKAGVDNVSYTRRNIESVSITIDVSKYRRNVGTYYVRVRDANGQSVTEKIVIN